MTPLEIGMLFHIDHIHAPLENLANPDSSQNSALRRFVDNDLIVACEGIVGWKLTARGDAYLHYLIAMPLPVADWSLPDWPASSGIQWAKP